MIAAPMARSVRPLGSEPADEEIRAGLALGDEDRLAVAHRRWGRLVHTLVGRAIGDSREAEDVTRQARLAPRHGHQRYRPDRGSVHARLVGIARRKIADTPSARRRGTESTAAGAVLPPQVVSADGTGHVVDRVDVVGVPARPSSVHQDVLTLAFFGDLEQTEIVRKAGMPLGTVKIHTRRGFQRLRGDLAPPRAACPEADDAVARPSCGTRTNSGTAPRRRRPTAAATAPRRNSGHPVQPMTRGGTK
ncbi:sigma factor-like helix-turn-helix DNA-binding protein [Streptomyces brasiliscabiei]|uniref:Sigma factor-like helix-turn-helix DNA-binding protein n=1 Tax=Streptomyces brasiliscabiei TaxID=2736302 RepID=A0ABU8GU34_9ACTN